MRDVHCNRVNIQYAAAATAAAASVTIKAVELRSSCEASRVMIGLPSAGTWQALCKSRC